jgi:hypothetical protein
VITDTSKERNKMIVRRVRQNCGREDQEKEKKARRRERMRCKSGRKGQK